MKSCWPFGKFDFHPEAFCTKNIAKVRHKFFCDILLDSDAQMRDEKTEDANSFSEEISEEISETVQAILSLKSEFQDRCRERTMPDMLEQHELDQAVYGFYAIPLQYAMRLRDQGHIFNKSYNRFERATKALAKNPGDSGASQEYFKAYHEINLQLVDYFVLQIVLASIILLVLSGLSIVLLRAADGNLPTLVEGLQKLFDMSEEWAKAFLGFTGTIPLIGVAYITAEAVSACSQPSTASSSFFYRRKSQQKRALQEKINQAVSVGNPSDNSEVLFPFGGTPQ
jgi:methyl-accepting chemotaxis protein